MIYFIRLLVSLSLVLPFVVAAQAQSNSATNSEKKKQVSSVDVNRDKNQVIIAYTDGSSETMSEQEANKKGIVHNGGFANYKDTAYHRNPGHPVSLRNSKLKPLVVVDGMEAADDAISKIKPAEIVSVNVLKDKVANDKYGMKGKNGVVEIVTKHPANRFKND